MMGNAFYKKGKNTPNNANTSYFKLFIRFYRENSDALLRSISKADTFMFIIVYRDILLKETVTKNSVNKWWTFLKICVTRFG